MKGMIMNSGILSVKKMQLIYLDFDGEETSYHGEILSVDSVQVEKSPLSAPEIAEITATLNAGAAAGVLYTTEQPKDIEFSTIYIGKTSSFASYGNFKGLSETLDHGNSIGNDNAFVILNGDESVAEICATIAHEAGHLLGTLNHGGEGLDAYAATGTVTIGSGETSSGLVLAGGSTIGDWGICPVESKRT